MDIIDIILARAKSFTGETATLTRQAQAAMSDANNIVDRLEGIEQDAQSAADQASAAAAELNEIKADFNAAAQALVAENTADIEANTSDISDLKERTSTLESQIQNAGVTVTVTDENTSAAKIKKANITKNGQTTSYIVEKNYTSYGNNEDGSMTQKAIKQYVDNAVSSITINPGTSGGGNTNLGSENAGSIVVVGPDGNITAGDTQEQSIIEALIRSGIYQAKNAVGLSIDYENKSMARTQEATSNTNFSSYSMFGGRKRCNVSDDGTITAFYGDSNYKEDGSNGQVMVYQPKFYYQRIPLNTVNATVGKVIRKESLIISPTAQSGFKLHPAFIDADGNELQYILLSAYEGCAYDTSNNSYITNDGSGVDFNEDKLSSIAGAKPISGEKNTLNITNAEHLATNRGEGWHILNMKAISVDQILSIIEYGTFNIQSALENGICNLDNSYIYNRACTTGSTAAIGNGSGHANTSSSTVNGSTNNYSQAGSRSICYRGEENPFGNIWKFVGGAAVQGDGSLKGGVPHLCKNYNYSTTVTADYESIGFSLPNESDWISGMGYGNEDYDWVFMPAETYNANSATPIGDSIWTSANLNGTNLVLYGGNWLFGQKNGMFYYACDKDMSYATAPYGTRLVFMPTKNTIHDNNYALWQSKMGG